MNWRFYSIFLFYVALTTLRVKICWCHHQHFICQSFTIKHLSCWKDNFDLIWSQDEIDRENHELRPSSPNYRCKFEDESVSSSPVTNLHLLDDIPLKQNQQLWSYHDGVPVHFSIAVGEHLQRTFGQIWVGRCEPVSWPVSLLDLNPLDFFIWGYLKTVMYAISVNDLEDL